MTGTSKEITGLSANTGYQFQVRAKNAKGASRYSTVQTVTTAPKAPTSISATSTTNTATISWNKVTGATGYMLNFNNRDYNLGAGATSYTGSLSLFEGLWEEWFNLNLFLNAREMQLYDVLYEDIFSVLPKEKQSELIGKKADFAKKAGITL